MSFNFDQPQPLFLLPITNAFLLKGGKRRGSGVVGQENRSKVGSGILMLFLSKLTCLRLISITSIVWRCWVFGMVGIV